MDGFGVVQVVAPVDAVGEDHARLGIGVGRAHDLVPQLACADRPVGDAAEGQLPGAVLPDRVHEGVGDQHREVEHAQSPGLALGVDEDLDVGMVAAQRRHHGAAPVTGAHDGAAHGVPHVHERERPRGVGADAAHRRALGPERREIVADAAALLHGQRGFLEMLEDARHVVGNDAHDEAVEQRHRAPGAGAGEDAPGRQEAEIGHRLAEAVPPRGRIVLGGGERAGDAAPAVLDRAVERRAVGRVQTVFHVPDAQ